MIRIYAAIVLIASLLIGVGYYGHTRFTAGAASIQAKWDAQKDSQLVVAVTASEAARSTEQTHAFDFASIATGYLQATTHAYPTLGSTLPAAVSSGSLQLRDACPTTPAPSGGLSEATARARIADAAVTQALADRVKNSIAAVQAGDDADARERQLGALIVSLQGVLKAERKPP